MKMAKPAPADIAAAGKLLQILDAIDFRGHWQTEEGPDSLEEALGGADFDCDDPAHLRGLYNSLAALLRDAPNFHGRVIAGMCYVICYHRNEILDPADDCLELHPDLRRGRQLLRAQQADFLPRLAREAMASVQAVIETSAARHQAEMRGGRP